MITGTPGPLHMAAFHAWVVLGELLSEKAVRTVEHEQEVRLVYDELGRALEQAHKDLGPSEAAEPLL